MAALFSMWKKKYLCSFRLQLWWKKRREDIGPPRIISVTCPRLTFPLLRWPTPLLPALSLTACGTKMVFFPPFFFALDWNYEEWVWAAGSSAAHGAPEHEEVLNAEWTCVLVRFHSAFLFRYEGMSCQHPRRDRRTTFRRGRSASTTPWLS